MKDTFKITTSYSLDEIFELLQDYLNDYYELGITKDMFDEKISKNPIAEDLISEYICQWHNMEGDGEEDLVEGRNQLTQEYCILFRFIPRIEGDED